MFLPSRGKKPWFARLLRPGHGERTAPGIWEGGMNCGNADTDVVMDANKAAIIRRVSIVRLVVGRRGSCEECGYACAKACILTQRVQVSFYTRLVPGRRHVMGRTRDLFVRRRLAPISG
jgi:hypothetical protein